MNPSYSYWRLPTLPTDPLQNLYLFDFAKQNLFFRIFEKPTVKLLFLQLYTSRNRYLRLRLRIKETLFSYFFENPSKKYSLKLHNP